MTQPPRSSSHNPASEVPQVIISHESAPPPAELPLASPIIHNAIGFTVAFGAGADGTEAIVLQIALPPLTPGGHDYLEQLATWCALRLAPAITRGRVAIVDRDEAEQLLDGITLAGGAETLGAGGWADRFVQFLIAQASTILELAERPALGDVAQDDPDAPAFRSSIGAGDVARPIDELERHAMPIEDESAAEHIANALTILRGAEQTAGRLRFDDYEALERRLELALEQLRKGAR